MMLAGLGTMATEWRWLCFMPLHVPACTDSTRRPFLETLPFLRGQVELPKGTQAVEGVSSPHNQHSWQIRRLLERLCSEITGLSRGNSHVGFLGGVFLLHRAREGSCEAPISKQALNEDPSPQTAGEGWWGPLGVLGPGRGAVSGRRDLPRDAGT